MDNQITVLSLLQRARDLVNAEQYSGIIEAIGSLKNQASGPKRDMAYYAVLETASRGRGDVGMSQLSAESRDAALSLLDATIRRIVSKLH